ncbi:hypothetical protein SB717_38390, partial [Priestia sp. SIMBA_032]|uniref:hypothetical protein n=1 Tax=Priestia sp. SIMBA_032 TaxID=3085775 RepID=UPI0039785458
MRRGLRLAPSGGRCIARSGCMRRPLKWNYISTMLNLWDAEWRDLRHEAIEHGGKGAEHGQNRTRADRD